MINLFSGPGRASSAQLGSHAKIDRVGFFPPFFGGLAVVFRQRLDPQARRRFARTRDEDDAAADRLDIADLGDRRAAAEIHVRPEIAHRPEAVAVARRERHLSGDLDGNVVEAHRLDDLAQLRVALPFLAIIADGIAQYPAFEEDLLAALG